MRPFGAKMVCRVGFCVLVKHRMMFHGIYFKWFVAIYTKGTRFIFFTFVQRKPQQWILFHVGHVAKLGSLLLKFLSAQYQSLKRTGTDVWDRQRLRRRQSPSWWFSAALSCIIRHVFSAFDGDAIDNQFGRIGEIDVQGPITDKRLQIGYSIGCRWPDCIWIAAHQLTASD